MSRLTFHQSPQVAVGAVVFKDDQVLLVQRGKAPSQGLWAIPGGSVSLGERLQQAAEREILEEAGIVIKAGRPIYTFDIIERDQQGRIRFHYVIVDLAADYVSGRIQSGDDASDVRWVSADELPNMSVSVHTLTLLKDIYHFEA